MRLKTFHGSTMREAMDMVRDELGPHAIIVSSEETPQGINMVAALDTATDASPISGSNPYEELQTCFSQHNVCSSYVYHLLQRFPKDFKGDLITILEQIFASQNFFQPLTLDSSTPLLLMGPPGVGKSLALAKLAAQCVLSDQPVHLITSDRHKAGAVEQLTTFAEALEVEVSVIENPALLKRAIDNKNEKQILLIDTPSTNPLDSRNLQTLKSLIISNKITPILTLSAEFDTLYSLDIINKFSDFNFKNLLITKMDLTKRLGNILKLSSENQFQLCAFGEGSSLAELLNPATPEYFANRFYNKYKEIKL